MLDTHYNKQSPPLCGEEAAIWEWRIMLFTEHAVIYPAWSMKETDESETSRLSACLLKSKTLQMNVFDSLHST